MFRVLKKRIAKINSTIEQASKYLLSKKLLRKLADLSSKGRIAKKAREKIKQSKDVTYHITYFVEFPEEMNKI